MPLDHYISQVHLRKFTSDDPRGMLHAIRKRDLRRFIAWPKDVCRTEEGNTTEFLINPRAVERMLRHIEPQYNQALEKLRSNRIDQECIYSIAGFSTYVDCCSPGGIRIHLSPLAAQLQTTAKLMDRRGMFGKAPAALGNKSLTELLDDGTVIFDIDSKYPQALGISTLLDRLSLSGNSVWEVLDNPHVKSSFVTSDLPIAIEFPADAKQFSRTIPLAPDLAVRIIPDPTLARAARDFSFRRLRLSRRTLSEAEAMEINRQLIRCAESIVFSVAASPWIDALVAENRNYRIDAVNNVIPHKNGMLTISSMRVTQSQPNAEAS